MGVTLVPFPSIVTALQYSSSAIAVTILGHFGVVERVSLDWRKAKQSMPAVVLFYVSIFTIWLLQHANVDTFIVFRSCCPLLVLPLEYLFLIKEEEVIEKMGVMIVALIIVVIATERLA